MGSASKVVDCILSLKAFQELKQMNNENGSNGHIRSPLLMQSASRMHSRGDWFCLPQWKKLLLLRVIFRTQKV